MSKDRLAEPIAALLLTLATVDLGVCVTLPRTPFTQAQEPAASPVGFMGVHDSQDSPELPEVLRRSVAPGRGGFINVLAISGGGANGAYGAELV
jgi:hypothetical protein